MGNSSARRPAQKLDARLKKTLGIGAAAEPAAAFALVQTKRRFASSPLTGANWLLLGSAPTLNVACLGVPL
jgi:hypothetical protein